MCILLGIILLEYYYDARTHKHYILEYYYDARTQEHYKKLFKLTACKHSLFISAVM